MNKVEVYEELRASILQYRRNCEAFSARNKVVIEECNKMAYPYEELRELADDSVDLELRLEKHGVK